MPVLNRSTLKREFSTGKSPKNQAFVALIDSAPNLADSTAQSFGADLIVSQAVATAGVSAGEVNVTNTLMASVAQFDGIVKHGVSAAVSANSSLGYPILSQEGTALSTAQIGLMPNSVNIIGLGVRVLAASSGGVGGTEVLIGNQSAIDYFGRITVSAVGSFALTAVSARRLTGTSGAVTMAAPTASAAANFLGRVEYYRIPPVGSPSFSLVTAANASAIGNFTNLSQIFDGVTVEGAGAGNVVSARGFAGQAWNDAKRIGQFAIFDPSNDTLKSGVLTVPIRLYGNNTNNINTASILASVNATFAVPTVVVTVAQTDIDTTNAYTYHWVESSATPAGTSFYFSEVQFWELII